MKTKEKLVEVTLEMEIVLRGSTTVLADGFRPGGFMKQIVTLKVPLSKLGSPRYMAAVLREQSEFLRDNVEVVTEQVSIKEINDE